jgi:hypothetical protein
MRKPLFTLTWALAVLSLSLLTACGGKKELKVSDQAQKLMKNAWKYDVNANLKKGSESTESQTGIKSDVQLQGDVGKMADFAAETLTLGRDGNDPMKLSYKKQVGEGMLSLSVVGWWELEPDDKTLVLKEWDSNAGKEKDPVKYTIDELSNEQLVLVKEGETQKRIYKKK